MSELHIAWLLLILRTLKNPNRYTRCYKANVKCLPVPNLKIITDYTKDLNKEMLSCYKNLKVWLTYVQNYKWVI